MIFKLFKSIYGYINLFYYITKIYYFEINIINDSNLINNLKRNINYSGSVCIKAIQWLLPRYKLLYPDSLIVNELSYVFNDCTVHSISYTYKKYKQIFNHDIHDKYNIIRLIGSGSIGQVYLIEDKITSVKYAMKVLHPNIDMEYMVFVFFYKMISFFINIHKYLIIEDIELFINELQTQFNLNIESKNMKYFSSMYNNIITIPEIYDTSKDIIIMEYIDGITMQEVLQEKSEYMYYKYVILLSLFIFNNGLSKGGILHGDLHNGNYLISKNEFKLTILDFGYCFKINNNTFKILFNMFLSPSNESIIEFLNNLLSTPYNKDKHITIEQYNKVINDVLKYNTPQDIVNVITKFTIVENLYLPNQYLNIFLLFLQLNDIIYKSNLYKQNSSTYIDLCNFCDTYEICDDYNNYVKGINKNQKKNITDKFKKFENLKNFL